MRLHQSPKSPTLTITDAQLVVVQPYSISADGNVGEETASAREDRHDHMLCKSTSFAARWNARNACRRSVPCSRAADTSRARSPSTMGAGRAGDGNGGQARAHGAAATSNGSRQTTDREVESAQGL